MAPGSAASLSYVFFGLTAGSNVFYVDYSFSLMTGRATATQCHNTMQSLTYPPPLANHRSSSPDVLPDFRETVANPGVEAWAPLQADWGHSFGFLQYPMVILEPLRESKSKGA